MTNYYILHRSLSRSSDEKMLGRLLALKEVMIGANVSIYDARTDSLIYKSEEVIKIDELNNDVLVIDTVNNRYTFINVSKSIENLNQ